MFRKLARLTLTAIAAVLFTSLAAQATVEIDYWGMWDSAPYVDIETQVAEEFNRQYAGLYKVNPTYLADHETKMSVAVAGGAPPAVVKIGRNRIGSWASQGILQTLDPLIDRDQINLKNYFPATMDEATYRGAVYGIPWNTDNRAMYYNKTLFEEAGLDGTRPPSTWEALIDSSRKLDRISSEGSLEQVALVPHWGNWFFYGWLWAAGGDLLDSSNSKVIWNNEAGVRALEFMQERLNHYGGNAALTAFNGKYGGFRGGALAMIMEGSWAFSGWQATDSLHFDLGVAYPPRPSGLENTPVTWSGGFALSIPAGVSGEKQEAAWQFIKFYTSEWAQRKLGVESGQIPALRAAAVSRAFLARDRFMGVFIELMQHSRFRPVVPSGGELQAIFQTEVHNHLLRGDMPARDILNETARIAQILLDEGWQRALQ